MTDSTEIPLLSVPGTLSYNGFAFSGGADAGMHIELKPVEDGSGRTIEFCELSISITKWIHTSRVAEANKKLTQNAGVLILTGMGFDDLTINQSGVWDVDYGPKPGPLKWQRKGGNTWWLLEWSVVSRIPICGCDGSTPFYQDQLEALVYDVDFSIDEEGMTNRSINGSLTIPSTKTTVCAKNVRDSADKYRKRINPKVPLGFKRAEQTYRLDASRRRLNFSFVDTEVNSDNPYPEGIVHIAARESVENEDLSFLRWTYSISGSVVVARPYPKSWAWEKFLLVVLDRANWQRQNAGARTIASDGAKEPLKGGIQLMTKLRFEDEIFGRRSTFSVSWILATSLEAIIKDSGIFKPIDDLDWAKWRDSMKDVWDQRGWTGLVYEPSNDAIVDLCDNTNNSSQNSDDRTKEETKDATEVHGNKPTEDTSWVVYKSWIVMSTKERIAIHKPLPRAGGYGRVAQSGGGGNEVKESYKSNERPKTDIKTLDTNRPDIIQRTGMPTQSCRLIGHAIRIGFEIVPPRLTSVNGITTKPIEAENTFKQTVIGSAEGYPIYAAEWDIGYILDRTAESPPKNEYM